MSVCGRVLAQLVTITDPSLRIESGIDPTLEPEVAVPKAAQVKVPCDARTQKSYPRDEGFLQPLGGPLSKRLFNPIHPTHDPSSVPSDGVPIKDGHGY